MKIARFEPMGAFPVQAWEETLGRLHGVQAENIDRYHPTSNALGVFPNKDGAYSWCRPYGKIRYDYIVFLPGTRLLDTSWTRAWLTAAASALSEEGQIVLPYRDDKLAAEPCGIPIDSLHTLFGTPVDVGESYAIFRPSRHIDAPQSVIKWFMGSSEIAIARLAEYRAAEQRKDLLESAWKKGCDEIEWRIDGEVATENLTADFLSETYDDLARYLVFSVQGINTKSYVLQTIFRELFGAGVPLRWADLGSGSGFLGWN